MDYQNRKGPPAQKPKNNSSLNDRSFTATPASAPAPQNTKKLVISPDIYQDSTDKKYYKKVGWGKWEETAPPTAEQLQNAAKNSGPVVYKQPALSPEQIWEQQWRAKQQEVMQALSEFVPRIQKLDPKAKIQIRGSLAKGMKGPQKLDKDDNRMKFDPKDFDIDAYVESDALYKQAVAKGVDDRTGVEGAIVGSKSKIPEINNIITEARAKLAKIAGNRDARNDAFQFNIYIRTAENAQTTTEIDQVDAQKAGLDPSRGNPLTVQPPKKR